MEHIEKIAELLDALGHPMRLRIIVILLDGDSYLAKIAEKLEISRALAKVHLMKLEKAGIVQTKVVLVENQAKALRYYHLNDFSVVINREVIRGMI